MSAARDQVARMLALVPYLRSHGGIPVERVADEFGVGRQQIVKDLNVLWFCGLPDAVTGEMIDVDMDALETEGKVYLRDAEFLARPLRLDADEALSLIVALRALRATATPAQREVVDVVLAKLETASGERAERAASVDIMVEPTDPEVLTAVTGAVEDRRMLHLDYLVPARDEHTERDVDPLRVVSSGGWSYLEAWCHLADDVRLFRLDRILEARVLPTAATDHPGVAPRVLGATRFVPSPDAPTAVLEAAPDARWVSEQEGVVQVDELPDGGVRVVLRVGDLAWVRRLVAGLAGRVRVVEPPELAAELAAEARGALAAYDPA